LQEILSIATEYKSSAGEYPGPIHAHTYLHFNSVWLRWPSKADKKQKQKAEKLQKSASFDPIRVTGNYGLGKVSS
jgi:hypothetical protein